MICSRERSSTIAIEFSVHSFNRLFFPILLFYRDAENAYVFSMRVSDVFIRKILMTDIARICRHDVFVLEKLRRGDLEQFDSLKIFFPPVGIFI